MQTKLKMLINQDILSIHHAGAYVGVALLGFRFLLNQISRVYLIYGCIKRLK